MPSTLAPMPMRGPARDDPRPAAPASPAAPPAVCPCCGGAPGTATIRVETRENKGEFGFFRPRTRYLVRWADVPLVCSPCMNRIELRRYVADVLTPMPLVVAFALTVAFDSKAYLWLMAFYALYLFRWAWGLGYIWIDWLLYGAQLEATLGVYAPHGDPGTTRFPSGLGHCLLRIGGLPALLVGLAVIAAAFRTPPSAGSDPARPTEPAAAAGASEGGAPNEQPRTRSEREMAAARAFLETARGVAVPVDPDSLAMKKLDVRRDDMGFFQVYADASRVPPGTDYQVMTGPQLLAKFLNTPGHDTDLMMIQGPGLPLIRWQAEELAPGMPEGEPPDPQVLRKP